MIALPLLRSPPFPGVAAEVAAVSVPGRSTLHDPDRLFAAMRALRVGGAFWSADDPWVAEGSRDGEAALVRWMTGDTTVDDRRAEAIAAIERAAYRDPFSGRAIDAHAAVAILGEWRRGFERNRGIAAATGMSAWKREAVARFLWDGRRSPPFLAPERALERAGAGEAIAYWPSRVPAGYSDHLTAHGMRGWTVEDGFLRSAGLGAECRPPQSIIVDPSGGIHFDASAPSEVEMLLAEHPFDGPLLERAARLRERIVATRLSKYGVNRGAPPTGLPADRRIVLAIGQVEDDLSVARSAAGTMHGFLSRVRAVEPDAFIVYRPHPDVMAGLRDGNVGASAGADLVLADGSLLALMEQVDAVHVLSSLTGFEALLRNVPVVVHGTPFYAGWGLTHDLATVPARRGRQLSLDALVAAALILAPRYHDPETGLPCPPEVLVERLAAIERPKPTLVTGFRRALGAARRTIRTTGMRR